MVITKPCHSVGLIAVYATVKHVARRMFRLLAVCLVRVKAFGMVITRVHQSYTVCPIHLTGVKQVCGSTCCLAEACAGSLSMLEVLLWTGRVCQHDCHCLIKHVTKSALQILTAAGAQSLLLGHYSLKFCQFPENLKFCLKF